MAFNTDLKVTTGRVRLSYAHLVEPRAYQDNAPKYSVTLMVPKSDKKTKAALDKAVKTAMQEQGWAKAPKGMNPVYKDGDKQTEHKFDGGVDLETNPEYAGHWIISASNRKQVPIFDRSLNMIDPEEAYSGSYANVSLIAFAYDVKGNTGVSFSLRGVQKVGEGDDLSGSVNAMNDFEILDEEDDEGEESLI